MELVEAVVKGILLGVAAAWEGFCSLAQSLPDCDCAGDVVQTAFDFVANCCPRRREE